MNDLVSVLDADAGLAELVPQDRRAEARRATAAAAIGIAAGHWTEPGNPDRARGGYGLLLVEGAIVRRVGIDGRYGAELIGPGDLLRPWQREGEHAGRGVDVARGDAVAAGDPRLALGGARRAVAAAWRRARRTRAGAVGPQRDRDGDHAAAEARGAAVDALLGARRPLRPRPCRRRASRPAAHARAAQPSGGRAPAVGVGRADAAREHGPAAPLRPRVGAQRRAAVDRRHGRGGSVAGSADAGL